MTNDATDSTEAGLARTINDRCRLIGTFELRSGRTATEYFDKYRFEADPVLLRRVAAQLASLIPEGTEVLAGLELGGVPIATALALHTGLPTAFVRKQAKTYGTQRLAEGTDVAGRRVLVVEDVVTSGGQIIESVGELRKLDATITHALCVIDRGDDGRAKLAASGITLVSLLTRTDLDAAADHGER